MSTKTRARRARAAERRRIEAERQRRRRLLGVALIGIAVAGVAAAVVFVAGGGSTEETGTTSPTGALAGQAVPLMGRDHVPEGTDVDYNSNPPTSGPHWPQPVEWGVYSEPLPDEQVVHNLEHGGIWITYTGVDDGTRARLEELAARYPQAVVLSPRPENDSPIVLASWGRLEKLEAFEEQRIVNFITSNINQSPEPLASVEQPAVSEGQPFPDFAVTEIDGRTITRDSLKGKPSIVWFTTTYCVPCQIGAVAVAGLDDELGGSAFDVLVLFVDPSESPEALAQWRAQFARDDWMVALDTTLASQVDLRFLDTKFLLDPEGVVQDIDVNIADQDYLDLIRREVEAAA